MLFTVMGNRRMAFMGGANEKDRGTQQKPITAMVVQGETISRKPTLVSVEQREETSHWWCTFVNKA